MHMHKVGKNMSDLLPTFYLLDVRKYMYVRMQAVVLGT